MYIQINTTPHNSESLTRSIGYNQACERPMGKNNDRLGTSLPYQESHWMCLPCLSLSTESLKFGLACVVTNTAAKVRPHILQQIGSTYTGTSPFQRDFSPSSENPNKKSSSTITMCISTSSSMALLSKKSQKSRCLFFCPGCS